MINSVILKHKKCFEMFEMCAVDEDDEDEYYNELLVVALVTDG